ncbi:uncharacterized protein LOC116345055 [Contarinia nasturtii]|uniref:uncharacterized protein LOC116345055 n=1 Tax=Contarinia nasturtii TaxID=265458 RepID=UPI0012D46C6A|nr:uncharacterized protein LOC116345055 [Contarinia nasturtii]
MWSFLFIVANLAISVSTAESDVPEYIIQCRRSDSKLLDCLKGSLHHLRPYLAQGIPEIEMPSVEPFIMDSLSLQLTGGHDGYRINLKNMEIFGASNFTVKSIKLSENNRPFEARIAIPRLSIRAKYASSGVLLIIPASGAGDFDAVLDGVIADLKGQVSTEDKNDKTYLHVDSLAIELNVKKVRMHIAKVFKNSRILTEATNLFLRENGIEVLKAMQPQLQKKLSVEFSGIANQLLKHVPREAFLID